MNKGFKKNNIGMTLVELLVAMAIFVAAIVPMLYAFVYATGFNFKSQRTMQATGIAQAIIEKAKSYNYSYDDFSDEIDPNDTNYTGTILDGTQFTVMGNAPGAGSNRLEGIQSIPSVGTNGWYIYGVRATNNYGDAVDLGNVHRRAYDVAIRPLRLDDSITDYSTIQSMGKTTFNFADSCVMALRNEDQVAQTKAIEAIKDLITDNSVISYDPVTPAIDTGIISLSSYLSESDIDIDRIVLDREITIDFGDPDSYQGSSGTNDQSVRVVVKYYLGFDTSATIDGIADSSKCVISKPATINGHSYTLKIDHNVRKPGEAAYQDFTYSTHTTPFYEVNFNSYVSFNEAASAAYFYYYPGYMAIDSDHASIRDHFIINNNMTEYGKDKDGTTDIKKLDFYLFKQYDRDFDSSHVGAYSNREEDYRCSIDMTSADHNTYLFHNLYWRVIEDVSQVPHVFKLVKNTTSHITTSVGSDCMICSEADSAYNNYCLSYKYATAPLDLSKAGTSYVLSNYACLPYYHLVNDDAPHSELLSTRYRITVRVFPEGDHAAGSEIETVTCEILNW